MPDHATQPVCYAPFLRPVSAYPQTGRARQRRCRPQTRRGVRKGGCGKQRKDVPYAACARCFRGGGVRPVLSVPMRDARDVVSPGQKKKRKSTAEHLVLATDNPEVHRLPTADTPFSDAMLAGFAIISSLFVIISSAFAAGFMLLLISSTIFAIRLRH